MNFSISTPTQEPVSVDEVKDQCGILTTDHDAKISGWIKSARQWVEGNIGRALITQTITYKIEDFPYDDELYLPRPPLVSVTSVKYIDTSGATQTWSSGNYTVDTVAQPGRIIPTYNTQWPSVQSIDNAVTITYVAGYGTADNVPQAIKQAIMLKVISDFKSLTGNDLDSSDSRIDSLLGQYRTWYF